MKRTPRRTTFRGPNFLAILVACMGIGIAQIHFDPIAIGGSPSEAANPSGPPQVNLPPAPLLPELLNDEAQLDNSAQAQQAASAEDPEVLRGIWALKIVSSMLRKGIDSFQNVPGYTATFFKQERMHGILGDEQSIELKMKHEPFSVYMKWTAGDARGQQLIYVEGLNDGNLLVQPGGIRGRLTGVLSLEPDGTMAMSQARHPVTQAGLVELARTILQYQDADLERGDGFLCELHDNQKFADRDCYLFTCVYENASVNADYRKSLIFIDKELSMPVCVKNYTWAKDANPDTIDEETLAEFYAYSEIQLQKQLIAAEFDASNPDYRMRVRR